MGCRKKNDPTHKLGHHAKILADDGTDVPIFQSANDLDAWLSSANERLSECTLPIAAPPPNKQGPYSVHRIDAQPAKWTQQHHARRAALAQQCKERENTQLGLKTTTLKAFFQPKADPGQTSSQNHDIVDLTLSDLETEEPDAEDDCEYCSARHCSHGG
ncbi:hypothetical protein CPB85DRAFT_1256079 [Mucidula mucida]|nr:hypothetical protein CPB85DRAFT_1256079 [Mucidula mucida]